MRSTVPTVPVGLYPHMTSKWSSHPLFFADNFSAAYATCRTNRLKTMSTSCRVCRQLLQRVSIGDSLRMRRAYAMD
jgi:hypothetical protein